MTTPKRTALATAEPLRNGRDHNALVYVLKALAHPRRLEIVQWLILRGPLSVRGIREFVDADDIGPQMRILEVAGLVEVVGRVKAIGGPKLYAVVPGSLDYVARLITGRGMSDLRDIVPQDDDTGETSTARSPAPGA